jgi:hypothetical protein
MAQAPRPTSSMSSTCQDVWCRKLTGARHTGQVVGVVGADPQLDQPPGGRGHQPQLTADVEGAEPPAGLRGQAELSA